MVYNTLDIARQIDTYMASFINKMQLLSYAKNKEIDIDGFTM